MEAYQQLRIVFMGTPDFAVASLDALIKAGCNVVAVITAPDKPAGRGMQLQQSSVKKFALQAGIPVLQPEKLRDETFLQSLRGLKADLQVCVAFRMLPEAVWDMPPMGTINLHGSLLPQYRGAAPINWAVINGEKETGVTTFKLKHQIDTGDILLKKAIPVEENDTAGTVHDKLMEIGAALVVETVKGLADGSLQETPQAVTSGTVLHHAPKIFTETCEINFDKPLKQVYDLVRGLSPFPTAFTILHGKKLKIYAASKDYNQQPESSGTYITDGTNYLAFACSDGYLQVSDVQLEGKKRMPVTDFLRGYRFPQS
ncbi:MAG: methionyl-tRNA formyltransferase [Niabella sp.]